MSQPVLQRHLGLWSAVLLVVGSVIGSGIFMKPLDISRSLPDEGWIFGAWAAKLVRLEVKLDDYSVAAATIEEAQKAIDQIVFCFGFNFNFLFQPLKD